MKPLGWLSLIILSACLLASCRENDQSARPLTTFIQHDVTVTLFLERGQDGDFLIANFTPADQDAHFYSKDLPPGGLDGLGRPTRLDLQTSSLMQPRGDLQESAPSETIPVNPDLPALPVYPAGPVTLRLPVTLPAGTGRTLTDHVLVSYMACTPNNCYRPVVEKVVEVHIPTSE